jgi:hypothetical protein
VPEARLLETERLTARPSADLQARELIHCATPSAVSIEHVFAPCALSMADRTAPGMAQHTVR